MRGKGYSHLGAAKNLSKSRATLGVLVGLLIVEYVSGGLVTFDDPADLGFTPSSFSLTYPAVLPLLHRLLGVALIIGWLVLAIGSRERMIANYSRATVALIVLQSVVGLLIVGNTSKPLLSKYLVLTHFSMSGLIIIAAGLTLVKSMHND